MNNFTTPTADADTKVPKHLESLVTTVFQSLFPSINPQVTPLKSIRRVLLLNREAETGDEDDGSFILNFRHYAITMRATDISRPLRRLNAAEKLLASKTSRKGRLPNLGKLEDIADYMVGGENGEGYMTDATSGSELDTDAEVEVLEAPSRRVSSHRPKAAAVDDAGDGDDDDDHVEKRAIKLVELGPRMRLRLLKVEEGLCSGKVMWHDYLQKTKDEVKALDAKWEQRGREKEARRKIQRENVERKLKTKARGGKATAGKEGEDDGADDAGDDYDVDMDYEFDSEGLEGDAEYQVNEQMEEDGEWEDEEDEIRGG